MNEHSNTTLIILFINSTTDTPIKLMQS